MEWGTTATSGMTLEVNVYRTLNSQPQAEYNFLTLTLGPLTGLSASTNTYSVNVARSCPYTANTATSDSLGTFGSTVYVKHPLCGNVCFTTSALSIALSNGVAQPTGFFSPGSGVHTLVLTVGETTPIAVSLDGVPYSLHYMQSSGCATVRPILQRERER
jgi:hypothetical protein